MEDRELYQIFLGLASPWEVERVELRVTSAIGAGNEFVDRLGSARDLVASSVAAGFRRHHRRLAVRPASAASSATVARVCGILYNAVIDADHAMQRQPITVEGLTEQVGIERIRKERDALVGDLLTDLGATALLGGRTAAFIGGSCIERAHE